MASRVVSEAVHDGRVLRLILDAPPGNVLDRVMMRALAAAAEEAARREALKAIILTGAGAHFSYGASIPEHRPATVRDMLREFHRAFRVLAATDLPLVAVVRGRCLGGGMELACFCHRVIAATNAQFAQPEIKLGVFAPSASLILPLRAGQAVADDLLLSGRALSASEALAARVADEIAVDPAAAADAWIATHLLPRSGAALRRATRAARTLYNAALLARLEDLERLYLDDLMKTADAVEGLEAFVAKRPPIWQDR